MNNNITAALHTARELDAELRLIYKNAIGTNDALLILAGQLLAHNAKIIAVLAQLDNV